MNPVEHRDVPVGTLHRQDRNGPVTVLRDYDTLLVGGWRLPYEEAVRLRGVISDALPDMAGARAQMTEEAAVQPVDGEVSEVD